MYFPAVLSFRLNQGNVVRHMAGFAAEQISPPACVMFQVFICRQAANLSLTNFTSLEKMSVLERSSVKIKGN